MLSSKKLPVKGLRGRSLSVRGPIRVYCILIHTRKGGGGRDEPERRGEGQQLTIKLC